MEANENPKPKKPKTEKPAKPRALRAGPTYYLIRHGEDGALTPIVEMARAKELKTKIASMTEPGKYSLIRVLKSIELKQGLLAVGATFGGGK